MQCPSSNKKQRTTWRPKEQYADTTLHAVYVFTRSLVTRSLVSVVLSKPLLEYISTFAPFHRYYLDRCLNTLPSYLSYRCCYETSSVPDHFHSFTRVFCHVVAINTLDGYAEMNTCIVVCRLCARYVFRDPLY